MSTAIKIDCYPYLLTRVGTLPFSLLETIQLKDEHVLEKYLLLQTKKKELEQQLPMDVKALSGIKKKISQLGIEFEEDFSREQALNRVVLTALAGNEILQKGLLQSSQALWQGVQRYRLQSPQVYRKKERQTERSIAQYLARICAKTSPFSTFTALSLNSLSGLSLTGPPGDLTAKVRINNYVLAQLQELLVNVAPFYKQLPVRANPTLLLETREYVFLLNSRNVESVQRMEQNEVIDLVLKCLGEPPNESILFGALIDQVSQSVDAETKQLEAYLMELIRFGLLIWKWPVYGTDPEWSKTMLQWISGLCPFEGKKVLMNVLKLLQQNAALLPEADADQRWLLLQESMAGLTDCFKLFTSYIPFQDQPDQEAFVTFQNTSFDLPLERLYFEDSHLSAEMTWPEEHLSACIHPLAELTNMMMPFRMYTLQEEMLAFFKKQYPLLTPVGLLTFYETFHQQKTEEVPERIKQILTLREKFTKKLESHIKIDENFDVHLSLSNLRMIMASLELNVAYTQNRISFGALIQFYPSDGQYKSYVDAVFTGYGKMLGRFLYLFPQQYTSHLSEWVDQQRKEALWVDNSDASFHNANAHPPILNKTFAIPGAQHNAPFEQLIPMSELTITFSESDHALILCHGEEEVSVFDYGLEALASRSPLYQMLSTFSLPQPDLSSFKTMLLMATQQKVGAWVRLPRVTMEERLVLQRKAWFIPLSELPLRQRTEAEAAYFLRINFWRVEHQLPESVFITTGPLELDVATDERSIKHGDRHKPQYIHFKTPALLSHFARELKNVKVMLKIEEMLPAGEEMLKVNGQRRVTELVVQWESMT